MILDEIVANKRIEVAEKEKAMPISLLEEMAARRPAPLDFAGALRDPKGRGQGGVRLIAEIKRASPSKGLLRPDLDPPSLARIYAENGAAAISVLTEERYFLGSLETLDETRSGLGPEHSLPLLRKDFIFSPYQVIEARAYGADALLLIVAILGDAGLADLLQLTRRLGMEALVEVHDEAEVERALAAGAKVVGINNRDLRTFKVDVATTGRLRPLVPTDRVVVSESGIRSRADVEQLRDWGVDAMLVGEALVTAGDVTAKVRELG